jgi:N-acetylneuraminic acid mutarotase
MKKNLLFLFTFCLPLFSYCQQWTRKADLPADERISAACFTIGTKAYVGTGRKGSDKRDFWEYDPTTNLWTQKADLVGIARNSAVGFSIGTKGYIATGESEVTTLSDLWEYGISQSLIRPLHTYNYDQGTRQLSPGCT